MIYLFRNPALPPRRRARSRAGSCVRPPARPSGRLSAVRQTQGRQRAGAPIRRDRHFISAFEGSHIHISIVSAAAELLRRPSRRSLVARAANQRQFIKSNCDWAALAASVASWLPARARSAAAATTHPAAGRGGARAHGIVN